MKAAGYLYAILLLSLISGCSKVFVKTTIRDEDIGSRYQQFVLDESVEFYIRRVCRVQKDTSEYPARVMSIPGDCFDTVSPELIESSYMFIFPNSNRALVINNIPDKKPAYFSGGKV